MDYNLTEIYAKMLGKPSVPTNKPKTLSEAVEQALGWKKNNNIVINEKNTEKEQNIPRESELYDTFIFGSTRYSIEKGSPDIFKRLSDTEKYEALEDPNLYFITNDFFKLISPTLRNKALTKYDIIIKLNDDIPLTEKDLNQIKPVVFSRLKTIFNNKQLVYVKDIYYRRNILRTDNLKIQEICKEFITTNFKRLPLFVKGVKPIEDLFVKKEKIQVVGKSYDELISKAFEANDLDPNLKPKGKYIVGKNTPALNEEDKIPFQILFPLTPPVKGKSEGVSKTTGNGEIAVYWLLKSAQDVIDPSNITETVKRDRPDLFVKSQGNTIGVEVKSYPGENFVIGKFQSHKKLINTLSVVFGISHISNTKESTDGEKSVGGPERFNGRQLLKAFEEVISLAKSLHNVEENNDFLKIKIISSLQQQLSRLQNELSPNKTLHEMQNAEAITATLLKKLLIAKLSDKPGIGGYFVNVKDTGELKYYKVSDSNINEADDRSIIDDTIAKVELVLNNFQKYSN